MTEEQTDVEQNALLEKNATSHNLWAGFAIIVLLWGIWWAGTIWVWGLDPTFAKFDPLSALFSGLAFWGVIYAIFLQRDELALQRRELMLTRVEVQGQKEQLKAQNATLQQQRFEDTFFSLLNLHTSLVKEIEIWSNTGRNIRGRECFGELWKELRSIYTDRIVPVKVGRPYNEVCLITYREFSNSRQADVGHYFRTMYNIIKFVHTSDNDNKQVYINILRAQLSDAELLLLFYNCLGPKGRNFKIYVEEYGLLKNLETSRLLEKEHQAVYEKSSFQNAS